jgi:hypothetical protein
MAVASREAPMKSSWKIQFLLAVAATRMNGKEQKPAMVL